MPEVCRFFGILIALYYDDHNPPHFHAKYGDEKISIEIATLRVLEGRLPSRALGMVMEWASLHQNDLLKGWEAAKNSQVPEKIEPLQ